ncbi:hypothetical protein JZ751_002929 [Albula glossodonta]|uniref:Uncharacterized protein n=1 Tax=Albula glossodonta TaxID=121402 RepID=A0A8T2NFV6_9TELE|nr:hypothetical protein JZ751_002929 [Albula glossodonta]
MLPPCGAACVENSVDGDCLNPAPAPTLAGACSLLSESHPKMSALNSFANAKIHTNYMCSIFKVSSCLSTPPADTDPEETSREPLRPPASPLIQTKLLASPYCRNTPSFLYQISCQWLPSPNLRPQDHSHKRGFFF